MASIPVIGIDLGTTNTCVGVYKNGKIEIIANQHGKRTTPSVVFFEEDGSVLIGDDAKDESYKRPKNAIYDIKRIIGSNFDDEATQKEIKRLAYDVINDGEKPKIRITSKKAATNYFPEQISAMILKNAKKYAEDYFGREIKHAVITVPAYFNNSQRQATKDAGEIAGLEVLRIINEPTAAALAYGWENKSKSLRNVLVYDFGGGTFDVSIVSINGEKYKVKATKGDTHLGGSDIDKNIMDYIVEKLEGKCKNSTKEWRDRRGMLRIRARAVNAKDKLSSRASFDVEFDCFQNDDLSFPFRRLQLEEMNLTLFNKTICIVEACLADAKMSKRDITDIVLVGGSTRIPKIQEILTSFFDGKNLIKAINPDEAVAYGAAIQAATIFGGIRAKISDVTAFSLSVNNANNTVSHFIKRNSPIPCKVSKVRITSEDNQGDVWFRIYQGESSFADENHLLGKFFIKDLPKRPRGQLEFDVTFNIDYDGVLHVDAVTKGVGLTGGISIGMKNNCLSVRDMKRLLLEEFN